MELLKAVKVNLKNGSKDILVYSDFRILEGEKYGLIGPNGAGKTTLINLILGKSSPDSGILNIKKDLKIGYLPQVQEFESDIKIEDFLLKDLEPIQKELNRLEKLMADASPENMDKILLKYQKQGELFEAAGGYEALERGENLLKKLGLDNSLEQSMGTLSGGERTLVFFAKALISKPELLILDEPGNHLDYLGLAWLEAFINSFKGAVLIVSHNRYLLDKTCNYLFDMFNGELINFKGNYSSLKVKKYKRALNLQSEYESSKKRIESLTKKVKQLQSITSSQYNPPASIVAQLNDAKRKLKEERDKNLEKPVIENDSLKLSFGKEVSKSDLALDIKDFSFSYSDKTLFDSAELSIKCGEKVALVGPNGCGKTTLIKRIIEKADWNRDNFRIGPSQKVGYLSQIPEFSDGAITVSDEIRSWGALTEDDAFSIAKKFSFDFKDMGKNLKFLSGGEVNRIQLARLMFNKTNFLILDEPTNHMDIGSREIIEEAISRFKGTLLVISHDRYFLDNLVTRVVELNNKKLISYYGNFSDYFKNRYPVLPRLSGEVKKRGAERGNAFNDKSLNLKKIEALIENEENLKLELEKQIKLCLDNREISKGKKMGTKLDKTISRLDKLYTQWEGLI